MPKVASKFENDCDSYSFTKSFIFCATILTSCLSCLFNFAFIDRKVYHRAKFSLMIGAAPLAVLALGRVALLGSNLLQTLKSAFKLKITIANVRWKKDCTFMSDLNKKF